MSDPSSIYGYNTEDGFPDRSHTIPLTVFFGLFTAAHIVQAGWKRQWWLYATTVIFGLMEVIGWAARCSHSRTGYIIQTSLLVIAPCFLTAFIYVDLSNILRLYGPRFGHLSPKVARWIFVTLDIITILVQAGGGGIAASASSGDAEDSADRVTLGSHIVLAGIVLQLVVVIVYSGFLGEFVYRYYTNKAIRRSRPQAAVIRLSSREQLKLKLRLASSVSITVLVLWRSAFRVAELNAGWEGDIMSNQLAFDLCDGMPMLLCLVISSVLHIGWLNPEQSMMRVGNHSSFASSEGKHELV
ncbi:hypothetical protein E3P99_03993 [Wallemia hederae]|uniref:RTA1 domain protein n=1 Tax=Wallemia hederae TaxID=1540922 RepID=A0A4T0FBZ3_9BASI|nr:hypothetical protein E3P99_03993 [Wallemia hederae]